MGKMKSTLLKCIGDLETEVSRTSHLIDILEELSLTSRADYRLQEYIRICRITDRLRDVAGKLS